MALLSARDLTAAPPGATLPVFAPVSLDLDPGEWLALSGPNGGGKSTLALALAGLLPARSGEVRLEGRLLAPGAEGSQRARVAVILQDPAAQLFCATVADELALTARHLNHSEDRIARAVARWAAEFGLEDDLSTDPHALSAGRQQLVLLAAALVSAPALLIADEPAAHLDADARGRVLAAVRREAALGLALVWVTQEPRERRAADRVAWIGETPPGGGVAPDPEAAPGAPDGESALTIFVSEPTRCGGPLIRTTAAFRLEVPSAGILMLTGPNGCGKSVLMAAATGLHPIAQCQVKWRVEPKESALFVSQYPDQQIFEELVADELAYAAVCRGLTREVALARARKLLERLHLPAKEMFARRCWWLSGGEKRLIETVAGLIAPASLLALDEPSAGLDDRRREVLAELVRERALEGPVLVATQDLAWAGRLPGGRARLGQGNARGVPSISKKTD